MTALQDSATVLRIQSHLARLPGEIGCRHLARERDDVEASLLVDLMLVKPIPTRVPTCASHNCPRCGACPWEVDFLPEASGAKAGVKYRRTADGEAVAAGMLSPISDRLAALPLAVAVLAALECGPRSVFALHWDLVERARVAIRNGVNTERVAPDRSALFSVVRLLADLGIVAVSPDLVIGKIDGQGASEAVLSATSSLRG